MRPSLTDSPYFDSSWQSVEWIPVVWCRLKEVLSELETVNQKHSAGYLVQWREKLTAYWALYHHWRQADLNSRQMEWVHEIRFYLQTLQHRLFSSLPFPSSAPLPETVQKKRTLAPGNSAFKHRINSRHS